MPSTTDKPQRIKITGADAERELLKPPPILPESEWVEGKTMWDLPEGRTRSGFCSLDYYGYDEDEQVHQARVRKRIEGELKYELITFRNLPQLETKIRQWLLTAVAPMYPTLPELAAVLNRRSEADRLAEYERKKTNQTNLRLSDLGRDMLEKLAEYHGISYTDVVEMLVRREARDLGLMG